MRRRKTPLDAIRADTPAVRFLRSAQSRRARDLEQLTILGDLVKTISGLIHALQKERGASSIYLGSGGIAFADRLAARIADSRGLDDRMRDHLERMDEKLAPMNCSARLYTRVAFACRALDSLPLIRKQISELTSAPQDAVEAFTQVISLLLAVGFEAADIAADSQVSRALIALVNFAQGKEYAGQERATGGAALSRGRIEAADRGRLLRLQAAQNQAFKVFAEFADPRHAGAFHELCGGPDAAEIERMRASAFELGPIDGPTASAADAWYELTTRRMDAMRGIEVVASDDLARLCAAKFDEAMAGVERIDAIDLDVLKLSAPFALLVTDIDQAGDGLPKPMRSILDVMEAQSRRIDEINAELQCARAALIERKTIERAKGILMQGRRLSERDAYQFLRQTAMNQSRRIFEVAEAVIGSVGASKP